MMQNAGTFIKSNFDIFQNSVLAGTLLLLEKFMETEFKCPEHKVWGFFYGLLFIVLPTIMIIIVSFAYQGISCHTCCKNKHNDTDIEETETGTCSQCGKCKISWEVLKSIKNFVLNFKFAFFWVFILITDGRYIACVWVSAFGTKEATKSMTSILMNKNETTVEEISLLQILQIIGLCLMFILIITVVCCERQSKRNKMKYKHLLLEDTEIAIKDEAKKKREEFINQFVSRMNWNDFNPRLLNTQKTLNENHKNL
ncbi:uncharacterized protein LOC142099868 [Mixophyes fleayi]|uniref:uncharacterized protein LOC142099868 n=1 Tax=Mixophyes fleayi TaxID=3061075 RepID=UPI003F4DBC41